MNFETMSKQRKTMLIAAAVGIVTMFLPWVSLLGFSVNGMHGWGVLVFLCFLVAGAVAFLGDQTTNLSQTNWMIALVAGGAAALIMVINFLTSLDTIRLLSFGFYGAMLAAVALAATTYLNRSSTDSLQGGLDSLKGSLTSNRANPPASGTTTTTNVSSATNDPTRPTA